MHAQAATMQPLPLSQTQQQQQFTAGYSGAVPSALSSTLNPAAGLGLPPMVRRVVSRARCLSSRPCTSGIDGHTSVSTSAFASTRELKLARTQAELRAQEHARNQADNEIARARTLVSRGGDGGGERSILDRPLISQSPAPSAAHRDLGPLYAEFQRAAQEVGAEMANTGFPASIVTAFERTSYWKRAPPTQSKELGTIAWLFLHYALLPRVDRQPVVTTVAQLEDESLRITWRQWDFFCHDWHLVPQLTSKVRVAALYQRYGIRGSTDVGLTYVAFVKCLAVLSQEVYIVPSNRGGKLSGLDSTKARPTSATTLHAKAAAQNGNAQEKCQAFLKQTKLNDLEYVASGIEALERTAWYRVRAELTDAKSVYVHKPSCLRCVAAPASAGPLGTPVLRSTPCPHAHPPRWDTLEAKIIAGVSDPSIVLHLDPHEHANHGFGRGGGERKATTKPTASALKLAMGSTSSWYGKEQEEKTNMPQQLLSPTKAPRPHTAAGVGGVRPKTASSSSPSTTSFPTTLTPSEQTSFSLLRKYERLPLEDFWCSYPGTYVDIGVIEVLPPLGSQPDGDRLGTKQRDPSDLVDSALRPHRYCLELKNLISASLKVTVSTEGCDWLNVEYKQKGQLALGMTQKLRIQAPKYMPAEDAHLVMSSGSSSTAGSSSRSSPPSNGTIGSGVEKMGFILLTCENTWTYEVHQVRIPVYARLVLKGSNDWTSQPRYVPPQEGNSPVSSPNKSTAPSQPRLTDGAALTNGSSKVLSSFAFTNAPVSVQVRSSASSSPNHTSSSSPAAAGRDRTAVMAEDHDDDAVGVEPDERDWEMEDEEAESPDAE